MAALLEGSTLFGLNVTQSCPESGIQGIEIHGIDDHVIVTDSMGSVTSFKVSDHKIMGSWTMRHGHNITCPAVYNSKTKEYVVVTDKMVVRAWKDDDVQIEKAFRATVSSEVWRVHSAPGHEPVVLFQSGAVRLLEALLAEPQQNVENLLAEDESIKWSTFLASGKQQWILLKTECKGEQFLHVHSLGDVTKVTYRLDSLPSQALSFSAYQHRGNLHMLCLILDGSVYEYVVPARLPHVDKKDDRLPLPGMLRLRLSIGEDQLLAASLVALDSAHLAVVGVPHPSAGTGKDYLCIWNTNFQTLQAGKEMAGRIYGQLWCYGGKLFVPHGKVLSVIPFECQKSSLAAVLGKLRQSESTEVTPPVPLPSWGGDTPAVETGSGTRKSRLSRKKQETPTITVNQIIEQIKTSSEDEIEQAVGSLISKTDLPTLQLAAGPLANALVMRSLAQPSFYTHDILVQLVHTQCLCHSVCPELLKLALEKKDFTLCQFCLQVFPDIPETLTCACLKAFLSAPDSELETITLEAESVAFVEGLSAVTLQEETEAEEQRRSNDKNNTVEKQPDECSEKPDMAKVEEAVDMENQENMETHQNGFSTSATSKMAVAAKCQPSNQNQGKRIGSMLNMDMARPIGLRKAVLLNEILQTPFSDAFLLPPLKELNGQQVILFLQYLQFLYLKYYQEINKEIPALRSPTMKQIIDWMCLLVDAHFSVLVLAPDAKDLLSGLHGFVREQMMFVSDLGKIEGSLKALKDAKQSTDRSQYSIEMIELF